MFEDMSELEALLYMEKRFGPLSKSIPGEWSIDKVEAIDRELVALLNKFRADHQIASPLPRIRSWVEDNKKVNFLFFSKDTGKRILLADWLMGKEGPYEH